MVNSLDLLQTSISVVTEAPLYQLRISFDLDCQARPTVVYRPGTEDSSNFAVCPKCGHAGSLKIGSGSSSLLCHFHATWSPTVERSLTSDGRTFPSDETSPRTFLALSTLKNPARRYVVPTDSCGRNPPVIPFGAKMELNLETHLCPKTVTNSFYQHFTVCEDTLSFVQYISHSRSKNPSWPSAVRTFPARDNSTIATIDTSCAFSSDGPALEGCPSHTILSLDTHCALVPI